MRTATAAAAVVIALSAVVGPAAAAADPLAAASPAAVSVPVASPPPGWPAPPAVTAEAFLLLVADTGQVLAERAADEQRPVASTVKMLTAWTVLQRADPDDVVVVGDEVVGVGGASTGVEPGERWTVQQLLEALIVRSGNDAAVALAAHVGGSLPGFLDLMRADAAALGLEDVVLETPSGLEDRNLLTARDLARIARVFLTDPRLREIAGAQSIDLPGVGIQETRNLLLGSYPGATGIKTGYTAAAGYSLVASAEQDGDELVAVVLGSRSDPDRFDDAAALLDHGFDRFSDGEVGLDLALARAGDDVQLEADPVDVFVPVDDPVLTLDDVLTVEVPASVEPVPVRWNGTELFSLEPSLVAPPRADATGAAALGRYLQDRAYAAMRAATVADAWTAGLFDE